MKSATTQREQVAGRSASDSVESAKGTASALSPLAIGLSCVDCGAVRGIEPAYVCDACGGILEVQYRPASSRADYLPLEDSAPMFGEGNTPLVAAPRLARRLGVAELFLKCEFANPTGSFKDRPVAMGIRMAKHFGYRRVIVASSGNGAAATAALAARVGMEALVLVPSSTPSEKVRQAAAYGAQIITVDGPYSSAYAAARTIGEELDAYNVTTTFLNPYTVEGDKVVGYEIADAFALHVPDYIYIPIGAGPLLVGTRRGITERGGLARDGRDPRMVGVQARGNNPIVVAYREGEPVRSVEQPRTIAGGIADGLVGYTQDGDHTLRHIRDSRGHASDASDEQILQAQAWIASDEGIFVEPSSASAIAALADDLRAGLVPAEASVVVVMTGHGLKDMAVLPTPALLNLSDSTASSLTALISQLPAPHN